MTVSCTRSSARSTDPVSERANARRCGIMVTRSSRKLVAIDASLAGAPPPVNAGAAACLMKGWPALGGCLRIVRQQPSVTAATTAHPVELLPSPVKKLRQYKHTTIVTNLNFTILTTGQSHQHATGPKET